MSLYKRGNTWWIDYTAPNGERVRESAGTSSKTQAREFHDALKAEAWRVAKLGSKPRRKWDEAVVRYLKEKSGLRSLDTVKLHLRWLDTHLRGRYLDEISRELIERIAEARRERDSAGRCINVATTNRVIEVTRAVLRKACFDWEWIDRMPKIRLEPELSRRIVWITTEQAEALLGQLPDHQRDLVIFSLATGASALERHAADLETGRS
jgi:hypothetical protein